MRSLNLTALLLCSGLTLSAQTVISAHSGTVHLAEGAVSVDGKAITQTPGTYPMWKERSELRTDQGRAEILLTPGVFLRVGEASALRLIDNRLSATRVELLSGQALIESDDPMKENAVTLVYGDYEVQVRKSSVFSLDSQPAQLKVYHGEAAVSYKGELVTVKAGHLLPLTAALAMEKFDAKSGDELTRWSQRRSQYVSTANIASAKSLRDSGTNWSSGWYYNPYYSMYTYIPGRGVSWSPYGYGYFSPYSVYSYLPYGGGYYGNRGGSNSYTTHTGDQSGSFGRNSNSGLSSTASNSGGFGRGGSTSSAPAAASSGGSFSSGGASHGGGGAIGGGGHSGK
jgi:hypothetical protein